MSLTKTIYIRVDGNKSIMTGHVMRCLAIAQAARRLGAVVTFVTADREMEPVIVRHGFSVECLETPWDDLNAETGRMVALVTQRRPDVLLVDSYQVTSQYLESLQASVCVAYMDDLDLFLYPCDILINYNHYALQFDYESRYTGTRLLLGGRYTPLREEFCAPPMFAIKSQVENILITTGGSDTYNVAGRFVQQARENSLLQSITLHVAVGRFNPHYQALCELAKALPRVCIHRDVVNMAQLIQRCDLAVTAGGSTLNELCACGVPSVFFTIADNQKYMPDAFVPKLMLYAGDARQDPDHCIAELLENATTLANDAALRKKFSAAMQRLVDGNGAQRIAQALLEGRRSTSKI